MTDPALDAATAKLTADGAASSVIAAFIDPRLLEFGTVWAAAGTPRHVFAIAPEDLVRVSGARPADFTA